MGWSLACRPSGDRLRTLAGACALGPVAGLEYRLPPEWRYLIKPEPVETTRVMFALAVPFALACAVQFGSAGPDDRRFDTAVIALQVGGIALIVWATVQQPDGPFFLFPSDYFGTFLLSVPVLVAGVIIGAVLTGLAVARRWPFERLDRPPPASTALRRGAFGVAVLLTITWLLPAVVTDANVASSGIIPSGHIPTQADDYFAVLNGRTPLVDFVPLYVHLLPLVLAPVLAAFDMSLTAVSLLMVLLSVLALLALYGVLNQVTERPLATLALYVPLLAIGLFPWWEDGATHEYAGSYYAFFPGRYLGPFVVAWLCARVVRGRRLPIWVLFFVAGLAAINNPEFGVPAVLAAAVAMILGPGHGRSVARTLRGLAPQALLGLLGAAAGMIALTLLRSGRLPDPELIAYWTRLFAREGYGLEPMPLLGLHIPMYLTFVAAILIAAVRRVRARSNRTLTAMLGYAGVFGLLASMYFAGRSLPWNLMLLFPVWGLALALVAWTAAVDLRNAHGSGALRRALLPSFAAMTGLGVAIAAISTVPRPWQQVERFSDPGRPVNDVPVVQRFVEELSRGGRNDPARRGARRSPCRRARRHRQRLALE